MRRLMRAAAAVVAVCAPAGAVVTMAAPAGASGSQLTCSVAKGSYAGTIEFKHCTPSGRLDHDATITMAALGSGSGTLTWQKSGGTTTLSTTATLSPTSPACHPPVGKRHTPVAQEIDIVGTVTGGSLQYTLPGDDVSMTLCETLKSGKVLLGTGTVARF